MRKLVSIFTLVATAFCQAASIQISVTGTADISVLGYTAGQSCTFNWVINESFQYNPSNGYSSTLNQWGENIPTDSPVFSSISGNGLTGTLTRPSDPYSYILMFDFGSPPEDLRLSASSDGGGIGVWANGEELRSLDASQLYITDFDFPGTYTDPTAYFSGYIGSYTPAAGGTVRVWTIENSAITFTPTNVSIEAIPEPSTLVFIGAFVGGMCIARRRILS